MGVITAGRSDFKDFFEKSGVFKQERQMHHPFLVFTNTRDYDIKVTVITSLKNLLRFADSTPVMAQWPGVNRSDFFKFTVGDARKFICGDDIYYEPIESEGED